MSAEVEEMRGAFRLLVLVAVHPLPVHAYRMRPMFCTRQWMQHTECQDVVRP